MPYEKIKGSDRIPFKYDTLKIIFNDKCIERYLFYEYGEEGYSFNDIVKIAKENGYKENEGVILLIAETTLSGTIYIYGNIKDTWYEYGSTMGYA